MTTGITIHRRDGSVLFFSATATTTAQAVNELVAEARRNLRDADLRYADLRHTDLRHTDLRYANLRDADLRDADLRYADLRHTDLRYANLRDADLRYADLRHTDLRYANLRLSDLRDANLRSADLSSADLRYARNVPQVLTVGPLDGWLLSLTNTPDGWRFTAGCRYLTEGEARAHWADASGWSPGSAPEHGARMLAGVDALISMARALGWPEKLVGEAEAVVA